MSFKRHSINQKCPWDFFFRTHFRTQLPHPTFAPNFRTQLNHQLGLKKTQNSPFAPNTIISFLIFFKKTEKSPFAPNTIISFLIFRFLKNWENWWSCWVRRVNFAFFWDRADDCVGCESWVRKLCAKVVCGSVCEKKSPNDVQDIQKKCWKIMVKESGKVCRLCELSVTLFCKFIVGTLFMRFSFI